LLSIKYLTLLDIDQRFSDNNFDEKLWKRLIPNYSEELLSLPKKDNIVKTNDICSRKEFSFDGIENLIKMAISERKKGIFDDLCVETYQILLKYYTEEKMFKSQAVIYGELMNICKQNVAKSTRITPNYYRVAFFGDGFRYTNGKQYIYSSPLRTGEFRMKLSEKMAQGRIDFEFVESTKNPKDFSMEGKNFIQVGTVLPCRSGAEKMETANVKTVASSFDLHFNINEFMIENPFIKEGIPQDESELRKLFKKKTFYFTKGAFPHLFTRLEIDQRLTSEVIPFCLTFFFLF
jgi:hypothetical protein